MQGFEILELKSLGEYWQVRTALGGRLAVPFEVHKSVREQYGRDDLFEEYLARQTRTMLDTYGDERERRQEPAAEFVV